MSRRPRYRRPLLVALLMLATSHQPARAQLAAGGGLDLLGSMQADLRSGPDGILALAASNSDIVAFGIVSAVNLPSITASEILAGSPPAVDMGRAVGSGWNVALSGIVSAGSGPLTSVQRGTDIVWAAWVHRRSVSALVVEYDLFGFDGTPNALVNRSDPGSRIGMSAVGTGPFLVAFSGLFRLVAGGGLFGCDLSTAAVAGRYEGQLIVTLSVL